MQALRIVLAAVIAFLAGAITYDVWFAGEGSPDGTCPPSVSDRITEEELHAAYVMTQGMSRPQASPMWHDEQLRRSLTDPVFVGELEAHFCRMREMLAEP